MRLRLLLLLLATLLLSACMTGGRGGRGGGGSGDDDDDSAASDDDDSSPGDDDDDDTPCVEGTTTCEGVDWQECVDSAWETQEVCVPPTPLCDDALGCLACTPNQLACDGDDVIQCDGGGLQWDYVETCPPNAPCVGGVCQDRCAQAAATYSYLGCEFLAVSTSNVLSPTFDNNFAVVVGNPSNAAGTADVTVSRGGSVVNVASVSPGQTQAITLPMVYGLKDATGSETVAGGAYEITSTLPVAAYQYNPLDYSIGGTSSYSNDASLLLPEHALGTEYLLQSWPGFGVGQGSGSGVSWIAFYGGFAAVAATADNTTVDFTFSTDVQAGSIGPWSGGQSTSVTLQRGDVVQIISAVPNTFGGSTACSSLGWTQTTGYNTFGDLYTYCTGDDLTGTQISADQRVAVFGGHQCSFVPYDAWACDHLEEMAFPTATWGTTAVMSAPRMPSASGVAPSRYRVLAESSGTVITFTPAVTSDVTLSAGEVYEFETNQDFEVQGSARFSIVQALLSQDALGGSAGDPALGTGIPWIQVRARYDFLTPSTFVENWVNVVATTGTTVRLDGVSISGWQEITGTTYSVARVSVSAGSHSMESDDGSGFGITTYGYAPYTSYLYPGGLNFLR